MPKNSEIISDDFDGEMGENESSDDVYYKIYFENVDGDLADALDVTISYEDDSEVLYHGKARNLKLENSDVESEILHYGETRLISRGNIVASRTFFAPSKCIVRRSSPSPKPPCGGAPYLCNIK